MQYVVIQDEVGSRCMYAITRAEMSSMEPEKDPGIPGGPGGPGGPGLLVSLLLPA